MRHGERAALPAQSPLRQTASAFVRRRLATFQARPAFARSERAIQQTISAIAIAAAGFRAAQATGLFN
jgi:hypothetical protein